MAIKTYVFSNSAKLNTDSRALVVTPSMLYDSTTGVGFVVERNRISEELLQIPELNSGFINNPESEEKTTILSDDDGCYVSDGNLFPLIFKANMKRLGTYEVTVTLMGQGEISVFYGCRNLVYKNKLDDIKEIEISFDYKLTSLIPQEKTCMYEKRSIDISLVGSGVHLQKITINESKSPTIYIAGNSLAKEHTTYYPFLQKGSIAGWGQMLPVLLKKGVAVSNQSRNDLDVEKFRSEGHFALVQAHMKLGDYLLLNFDKNEVTIKNEDYISELTEYIEESRAMGVYPILVTPLSLNCKDDKMWQANACKDIAKKMNVPVVDLFKLWKDYYHENDDKGSLVEAGNLREKGALQIAKLFISEFSSLMEGARQDPYTKLVRYFRL